MKRFNQRNPTEINLFRTLAYGEGIISREQFLSIANRTILSRYRTEGYLKQASNAAKGVFQITDKFKKAYLHQIDPSHKFSGSGSVQHSTALNQTIAALPAGVKLTGGKEIQADFDRFKATKEYQKVIAELRQQARADLAERRQAVTDTGTAQALRAYDDARRLYLQTLDEKKCCSTPDLQATFTHDQLEAFISTLSMTQDKTREQAIERLQSLLASTTAQELTVCIEIITGSYGSLEIQAKETYSAVTQTEIIYISA